MSDAAEVIAATRCGRTFRDNRRGIAHLDFTIEHLPPGCTLEILQPPYNTGVEASAGTHDFGAVYDFRIDGMDWLDAQAFLRAYGWAAWWRQPPKFSHHLHAVSLGYPGRVGVYVPAQVDDYYNFRSGLAGHVADHTWHPADIDSTVFDYDAWLEAHMPLNDDDKAAVRSIVAEEVAKALSGIKLTAPNGKSKVGLVRFLEQWRSGK